MQTYNDQDKCAATCRPIIRRLLVVLSTVLSAFLSHQAQATVRYQVIGFSDIFNLAEGQSTIANRACALGGMDGNTLGGWETSIGDSSATNAYLAAGLSHIGETFTIGCFSDEPGDGPVMTIEIVKDCVASTGTSVITHLTTIASFDDFGNATATGTVANPQCRAGCVVQHPSGGAALLCKGYLDPTHVVEVGAPIWVACAADTLAIACNAGSQVTYDTTAEKPLGYAEINPDVPPTTGSGEPTKLGTPVDTSTSCVDNDGDGKDDTTHTACALGAATALAAIRSSKLAELNAIGTGDSLAGDLATAAAANGGMFSIPDSLASFLNPDASCNYTFTLPMGLGDVTTDKWCAIKTIVEPYLAFFMWVLTVFVLMSQWRRV